MNVGTHARLLAVLALASPVLAQESAPGESALRYRTLRDYQIELPSEQFAAVAAGFDFRGTAGLSFAVERRGTGIAVDTDGDGGMDVEVQGDEGFVTLRGAHDSGAPFTYSVRLRNSGGGWSFASSGALVGKIGNTKITLLDQNNNGSFADIGVDAMIVGRGQTACFLSRAVAVGEQLYAIDIADDGSRMTFSPWAGDIGTLDLQADMETKGKLLSAIVVSADRKFSFDLARAPQHVPAGVYRLHSGKLGLGEAELRVRRGRADDMVVSVGETKSLRWGGPARAEFAYDRKGNELILSPDKVWYFGDAGEEYFGWNPVGKSPEFAVRAGEELIASAIFPGSC